MIEKAELSLSSLKVLLNGCHASNEPDKIVMKIEFVFHFIVLLFTLLALEVSLYP